MEKEGESGKFVMERNNEYLISTNWLISAARSVGYRIELFEPVNVVGDAIVILSNE